MPVKECPRCYRQYRKGEYLYCIKCGERLILAENRCSRPKYDICNRILPESAEYCPYCGAQSTYHLEKQQII